ncbi:hypothetical protein BHE74_00031937 [Ensete ventricosum]|uniref:Uncharacterized protein n=1 Tax=Ensete ventricosum TaxID=4639 RepID=A0A426XJN8_ENSVE|nr:hypothetical protein B296_00058984 [Ensete ventricosum]RWW61026.1 hypothetical protein BHE74_00031937 [Ensete ventricosum]
MLGDDKGIKDARGAHERLAGGDGEVEEGNSDVLLGLDCRREVVVKAGGGKEEHDTSVGEGVTHLRVLLRQVADLRDGFGSGL